MNAKVLDDRDLQILRYLEKNARISISALAHNISLSPTAVRQRIARMEKDLVIKGYTIEMQKPDINNQIKALLILTLTGAFCKNLMAEFGHYSEIRKFWSLTGELDATIMLQVPNVERLNDITNALSDHELVQKVQTHIITETHVDR